MKCRQINHIWSIWAGTLQQKTNIQIKQNLAVEIIQICKLEVSILLDNFDNLINLIHQNWQRKIIVESKNTLIIPNATQIRPHKKSARPIWTNKPTTVVVVVPVLFLQLCQYQNSFLFLCTSTFYFVKFCVEHMFPTVGFLLASSPMRPVMKSKSSAHKKLIKTTTGNI